MKEATARIKINRLLEAAGWRFFDDAHGAPNIRLESNATIKQADLDALGNDFERTSKGFIDFLLLDERGFPLIVLEAKAEDKNPLAGKEQARRYARSQNCRFVMLSSSVSTRASRTAATHAKPNAACCWTPIAPFERYGAKCCISECAVTEALEAAHITPYLGENSNDARNGLVLRSDLHTLFDRYLLGIDPATLRVTLSNGLIDDPSYRSFDGKELAVVAKHLPSRRALSVHWQRFVEISK